MQLILEACALFNLSAGSGSPANRNCDTAPQSTLFTSKMHLSIFNNLEFVYILHMFEDFYSKVMTMKQLLSCTSHNKCIAAHCLINIVYLTACSFIRS